MGKNLDDSFLSLCFLDIDNFYLLFSICRRRYNNSGSYILDRVVFFIGIFRFIGRRLF